MHSSFFWGVVFALLGAILLNLGINYGLATLGGWNSVGNSVFCVLKSFCGHGCLFVTHQVTVPVVNYQPLCSIRRNTHNAIPKGEAQYWLFSSRLDWATC